MNEFLLWAGFIITAFLCAGTWCAVRELFNRWVNNDWCRHDWDMWSGVDKESSYQYRFCKHCNKGERRLP